MLLTGLNPFWGHSKAVYKNNFFIVLLYAVFCFYKNYYINLQNTTKYKKKIF